MRYNRSMYMEFPVRIAVFSSTCIFRNARTWEKLNIRLSERFRSKPHLLFSLDHFHFTCTNSFDEAILRKFILAPGVHSRQRLKRDILAQAPIKDIAANTRSEYIIHNINKNTSSSWWMTMFGPSATVCIMESLLSVCYKKLGSTISKKMWH